MTRERPVLDKLRELIRNRVLSVVVVYCLDRYARQPTDLVILMDELEKNGVCLEAVTEDVDSSDLGKLVTYIKGYAAKLEVEKIRERTQRGIRERVKSGRMPSGRRARLYGYAYADGVRHINETQAKYVLDMFKWALEGETLNGITYRLRELGIPTPSGKGYWIRSTVYRILTNPAYMGKTYCYYHVHSETNKHYREVRKSKKSCVTIKPYSEAVEIPGATPTIISEEMFRQVQDILKGNKAKSSRNGKVLYLLRGHIYCSRCGRKYWGYSRYFNGQPDKSNKRYYYCMGRRRIITPLKCNNRGYQADYLETIVWGQIEELLSKPDFIASEIERLKSEPNPLDSIENELGNVLGRLQELDREQEHLLQWALKGFPEKTIVDENDKINRTRLELQRRKEQLEKDIKDARENQLDIDGVEMFCKLASENLAHFTYEDKRLALGALKIKVAIDGDRITVHGAIPIIQSDIVSTQAGSGRPRWCHSVRW